MRRFEFAEFVESFGFISRVALIGEAMDHHPAWSNVFNTVDVALTTHDAGGITEDDVRMAKRIDRLLARED